MWRSEKHARPTKSVPHGIAPFPSPAILVMIFKEGRVQAGWREGGDGMGASCKAVFVFKRHSFSKLDRDGGGRADERAANMANPRLNPFLQVRRRRWRWRGKRIMLWGTSPSSFSLASSRQF